MWHEHQSASILVSPVRSGLVLPKHSIQRIASPLCARLAAADTEGYRLPMFGHDWRHLVLFVVEWLPCKTENVDIC